GRRSQGGETLCRATSRAPERRTGGKPADQFAASRHPARPEAHQRPYRLGRPSDPRRQRPAAGKPPAQGRAGGLTGRPERSSPISLSDPPEKRQSEADGKRPEGDDERSKTGDTPGRRKAFG